MTTSFWIKRALLVLMLSFVVIGGAQWLKTRDLNFALRHSAIWSVGTTTIYMAVLGRKLRSNPGCAVRSGKAET